MATLSGGQYITFAKPYLNEVANVIDNNKPLNIDGAGPIVIAKTKEVRDFIAAVRSKQESKVALVLRDGGQKFAPIFSGYRWTNIDKGQFTGKGGSSDAKTTAMQERASLYAIQKGIENNGFKDRAIFFKECRNELKKIYPGMDEEWEETFFQQQLTVYRELGNTKYQHYSRDEGFMDWITKFVKEKYGITQKDTWNPADIWLISNYQSVVATLERKIKDDVTPIQEFNAILRDMFKERKIVGISLKKMSGKTASWELVNLDDADIFDNDEYVFYLDNAACNCALKSANDFKTTDSRIVIKSKKQNITFQIRQNSAGFNNLKIEGTDIGASSARLGKVPLAMAQRVFQAYGLTLENDNKKFPKSEQEYLNTINEWESIYKKVKQYTNVPTVDKFSENMVSVFRSKRPDYAHSKLMQLKLFETVLTKLRDKKLDEFLTELAFLAQKKGTVFGPFGKLY